MTESHKKKKTREKDQKGIQKLLDTDFKITVFNMFSKVDENFTTEMESTTR